LGGSTGSLIDWLGLIWLGLQFDSGVDPSGAKAASIAMALRQPPPNNAGAPTPTANSVLPLPAPQAHSRLVGPPPTTSSASNPTLQELFPDIQPPSQQQQQQRAILPNPRSVANNNAVTMSLPVLELRQEIDMLMQTQQYDQAFSKVTQRVYRLYNHHHHHHHHHHHQSIWCCLRLLLD
jgi:hypothetical protein